MYGYHVVAKSILSYRLHFPGYGQKADDAPRTNPFHLKTHTHVTASHVFVLFFLYIPRSFDYLFLFCFVMRNTYLLAGQERPPPEEKAGNPLKKSRPFYARTARQRHRRTCHTQPPSPFSSGKLAAPAPPAA
jgi:hypothetical protein